MYSSLLYAAALYLVGAYAAPLEERAASGKLLIPPSAQFLSHSL